MEPLLGPVPNMDLDRIDRVIAGGETGPRARPMKEDWVLDIRDQCIAAKVPFTFIGWGDGDLQRTGRVLRGRVWDEPSAEIVDPATQLELNLCIES
jgi:protein gp37